MVKLSWQQESAIRSAQYASSLRGEVTKGKFVDLFRLMGEKVRMKSRVEHAETYGSLRLYSILGRKTWFVKEDHLERDGAVHTYDFLWHLASRAGIARDVSNNVRGVYLKYNCPFCCPIMSRFEFSEDCGADQYGFSVHGREVSCPRCKSRIHLTPSYNVRSSYPRKD